MANTQASRKVTRQCFQRKTLFLGTNSTNIPNTECQRTSERAAADVWLLRHWISKVGEIVYSVKYLTRKHEDPSSSCRTQKLGLGIHALVRQTDGSLELTGPMRATGSSEPHFKKQGRGWYSGRHLKSTDSSHGPSRHLGTSMHTSMSNASMSIHSVS